jgi:hypothetical protein
MWEGGKYKKKYIYGPTLGTALTAPNSMKSSKYSLASWEDTLHQISPKSANKYGK